MTDFILQNVPSSGSGSPAWSSLTNAAGNLTLANGTNTTEFDQTSNTTWKWYNTTTATSGTTNASPIIDLSANYWTGAASAEDKWTVGSSLAAGTNGSTTLTISHSGSTGIAVVAAPRLYLNGFTAITNKATPLGMAIDANTGVGFIVKNTSTEYTDFISGGSLKGLRGFGAVPMVLGTTDASSSLTIFAGAGTVYVGTTAAAGDTTGNLQLAKITKYNGTSTVRNGIGAEYASSDLTAQSAAITATTLISAPQTGVYKVSWSATITTASDISSVLGGTNGFQAIYTSPTDSVVKTTVAGNSVTSSANTTGTAVGGVEVIYAKTGTNIQYSYGYTDSHTSTAMQYELHISLEAL